MFKIDKDKLYYEMQQLDNGETLIICRQREVGTLLGMVWGVYNITDSKESRFNVHGSYINDWCRRQGIRRGINDYLFKTYKVDFIMSPCATRYGKAFMEHTGYKRDLYGAWYLKNPYKLRTRK